MDRRRGIWTGLSLLLAVCLALFALWTVRPGTSPDSDLAEHDPHLEVKKLEARDAMASGQPSSLRGDGEAESSIELDPLALQSIVARPDADAMRITGWVVSFGDRRPVPGAELVFMHDAQAHPVATDARGKFRFDAPEPGTYELGMVSAAGFLPYAPELGHSPVSFQARTGWSIDDVVFHLIPAIDLEGTVVSADGDPVSGAEVRLFGAASGERALVSVEDQWRTDADGRFTFHAPDWAVLEASHDQLGVGRGRVDDAVQVSHLMTIQLDPSGIAAGARLEGIVVDAQGEPVADVRIEAEGRMRDGEVDPVAPRAQAISEADGRFELEPLVAGIGHRVTARHPAYPVVEVEAKADGTELRIELPAGVSVSGVVVDAEGEPVPSATVTLLRAGDLFYTPLAATTTYDATGRFELAGVEPGEYRLEALAIGLARGRPELVTVGPEGRDDLRLELGAGATVVGFVRDADTGEALEGARVSVRGRPPLASSLVVPQSIGLTDGRGRFELRGVAPGRRSLNVAAFDHHPVAVTGLELVGGEEHGPVEVELRAVAEGDVPTSEISGIGAMLGVVDESLTIRGVLPDGGAERAGLGKGDRLHGIDGEDVLDIGFEAAIEAIRGPEGTTVLLAIERASDGERVDVPVQRAKVVVPPSP